MLGYCSLLWALRMPFWLIIMKCISSKIKATITLEINWRCSTYLINLSILDRPMMDIVRGQILVHMTSFNSNYMAPNLIIGDS